jgi:hypothetical protein
MLPALLFGFAVSGSVITWPYTGRSGKTQLIRTSAGSWTAIKSAIPSGGGAVTITLALPFVCDYDTQIEIPKGTNVTLLGNGAVLDAVRKGRFFSVSSGAGPRSTRLR